MLPTDETSSGLTHSAERKRWQTPVLTVGSPQKDTCSAVNTVGPDGLSIGGSSYGS